MQFSITAIVLATAACASAQTIINNSNGNLGASLSSQLSSELAAGSSAATATHSVDSASLSSHLSQATATEAGDGSNTGCGNIVFNGVAYTGPCTISNNGPTAAASGSSSTGGAPMARKTAGAMLGAGAAGLAALLI